MLKSKSWWVQKYGDTTTTTCALVATQLGDAIRQNNLLQVKAIITKHPHVLFTKIFNHKRTALYVASFYGKFEIVRLLLDSGADPEVEFMT